MTPPSAPALVTGASSGLGAEFAVFLAARGHPLVLVARRAERLEQVAARCAALGVTARTLTADLATEDGLAVCREAIDREQPGVVVLNAGFGSTGAFVLQDREREDRMVRLNCLAVTDLAHHALTGMRARGAGDLVLVSSAAAFMPLPGMANYAATKAFELHLGRALAAEMAGTGVRVVTVCPGPTRTEFSEVIDREGGRPDGRSGMPGMVPWDDPARVVARTWRALEAGRDVAATGAVSRFTRVVARVVPHRVAVRAAGWRVRNRLRAAGSDPRSRIPTRVHPSRGAHRAGRRRPGRRGRSGTDS
ncbi:MAG: SDR family NAD(P)-dependent oxidoreductase [Thermoleophilia bacterium]